MQPGVVSGEEGDVEGDMTPDDVQAYIADMAGSLKSMAQSAGLSDLAERLEEVCVLAGEGEE